MKKKFYAILFMTILVVTSLPAMAFAEASMIVTPAGGTPATASTAGTKVTTTMTLKELETKSVSITLAAGEGDESISLTGDSKVTYPATVKTTATTGASSATFNVKGVTEGKSTLTLTSPGNFIVEITITVTAASKPTWDSDSVKHDGKEMAGASYWNDANSTFYPGQNITEAFSTTKFVATTTNDTGNTWKMTGTFKPEMPTTGDTLAFVVEKGSNDDAKTITGKITGKIPSVAKKTTYTLTIDAEDVAGKATSGGSEKTITVKFTVNPKTTISASNSAVTWGEAFTLTPTISAGNGDGKRVWAISTVKENGELIGEDSGYLKADNFGDGKGLTFDPNTGTISGTWAPTTASTDANIVNFTNATTVADETKKVVLQATIGDNEPPATEGAVDRNSVGRKEITLTFKGAKPTITNTASDITAKFNALNENRGVLYNTDLPTTKDADGAINVAAMGPGTINWTVTLDKGTLADYGLSTVESEASTTAPATLTIKGKPTTTVKNLKLKITASNGKGKSAVIEPTLTIGANAINIYSDEAAAEGDKVTDDNIGDVTGLTGDNIKVGDSFTSVTLYAKPGPVTWTAKNLPEGITLTPDTKDSTKAVLAGSFKGARKSNDNEDKKFEIKAVNANYTSLEKTITGSVMVWAEPEVINATLFKKNVIETGTAYEVEITASNTPVNNKWKITAGTTSGGTITLLENGVVPDDDHKGIYTPTTSVSGFTPASSIKVDSTKLTDDNFKVVLIGSLDCVPKGGEKIKFSITAGNNAGSKPKDFEVTVKGKAPALKKEDITLSGTEAKDIKVTAGDGPITMKAYVDAKTAKKIFGVEDDIDLTKANVTGLLFEDDGTYTGAASIAYSTTTTSVPSIYNSAMAYSKLPVTVEASNSDVSTKAASAKYTVTIAATAKPSWKSVYDLSTTYKNADLTTGATLKSSNELLIEAGTALPAVAENPATGSEPLVFQAAGDGPWEVTVKPETKNGLTAAYTESTGKVAITGKVESGKKDVTTKFTLTLKNPSTGETAKSDITIVAKQKPTVDNTTLEKSVLYGKKVKLAPKVTASSNGMKWLISSIGTTNFSGTDNTDAKAALKELHGLDFDENKGAISGTPNHATGKDNPITITMVASTDLAIYDDEVTAKIAVLGEKAKLTTKKVTVAIDGTDVGETPIETNLKGYDSTRANVTFEGNFSNFDAVKSMSFSTPTEGTTTLSGKPDAVTKKVSVTVKMTNYDTETTGKLSITVEGATPEISAVDPIEVTAGSSNTADVSLSDTGSVSQKIKWKVAKKPNLSGVSAKIKGDANGATITVKANKRVADGATATFSITATDSLSKKTSEPLEVTINVLNPTDTEAAPLEANDVAATPEAKTDTKAEADEKVLGEGEVHMGAERTADKLTAQQRKFFEDEGYVIAAVLPEIEVTAAGQYDFEVDLDKEVETGAELVWFAFASKPTTDDEIVDFADEKGKETKVVPESHVVTVAPWLNAETKYAPVIAVKAAAKDADATTVEGVKEAAEAKTEE